MILKNTIKMQNSQLSNGCCQGFFRIFFDIFNCRSKSRDIEILGLFLKNDEMHIYSAHILGNNL